MRGWSFGRMEDGGAVLTIEGVMESETPWFLEDGTVCAPDAFRRELEAVGDGNQLMVLVNSPGGDCGAGVAMYTMLRQRKGRTVALVTGIAYSAATLPLCGCDEVLMSPAATLMVHDPAVLSYGAMNDAELERAQGYLRTVKEAVLNAYAEKTGLSRDVLSEMMTETRYMTADEAIDSGFADRLAEKPQAAMRGMMREGALRAAMDANTATVRAAAGAAAATERSEMAAYAKQVLAEL